jgi:hypothetical protein
MKNRAEKIYDFVCLNETLLQSCMQGKLMAVNKAKQGQGVG